MKGTESDFYLFDEKDKVTNQNAESDPGADSF
jgi:hypothetical protein